MKRKIRICGRVGGSLLYFPLCQWNLGRWGKILARNLGKTIQLYLKTFWIAKVGILVGEGLCVRDGKLAQVKKEVN